MTEQRTEQHRVKRHCRYCGGGAVELEAHEEMCVMRGEQQSRAIQRLTIECERFEPGDCVRYIPGHAHGDRNHPDCEDGRVSSENGHSVFVRFNKTVAKLGWGGTTSQSCDPADLVKI